MAASTAHIYQALFANVGIAVVKGVAAAFTGSGAMLAETIHSAADCGNQLLLLFGVKRSRQPPTPAHPLGYGRALYFWSFMVAMLLFTGGGMFSIYEGVHKIQHPEPVEKAWLGIAVLAISLLIEGSATWSNIREMRARANGKPLVRYLRETKDSDLVVIFGENAAATLGLALALKALALAAITGDARWDGAGTLAIGLVLVLVAVFLAVEVKSLLLGESADPEIGAAVRALAQEHPDIEGTAELITVQQGPGEVLVSVKLSLARRLSVGEAVELIADFERKLSARCPEVRWCFVEPA
jgi:cation diffusion facilitator family transporter